MPVPVLLATDALFFLLFLLGLGFALVARRREHLRAPWRRVARSRAAVAAAVVLAAYAVVGLLDSLHFHPALDTAEQRSGATHSTEARRRRRPTRRRSPLTSTSRRASTTRTGRRDAITRGCATAAPRSPTRQGIGRAT